MTEDKIVGGHHGLNGHEFEQALGDSEGQGSLVCCSPWGHKESNTVVQLNNNDNPGIRSCGFDMGRIETQGQKEGCAGIQAGSEKGRGGGWGGHEALPHHPRLYPRRVALPAPPASSRLPGLRNLSGPP